MDRKMIKYILVKAIQISALILLPLIVYGNIVIGKYIWASFDLWILCIYILESVNNELEKNLHGELY